MPLPRSWQPPPWLATLREPGHAVDLAVFRIAVFAVVLLSPDVHSAAALADLPRDLQQPHESMAFLAPLVSPLAARLAHGVLVAAAVLGLVGWRTRPAALVALVAATYLLGIPQLYGTVRHYHHLIWFLALLAASPCGDALSLDRILAARAGRPAPQPAIAYGTPLRFAWLLVGCVYFFPGLWKWATSGLAWALSDNLAHLMHGKWAQHGGWTPSFRVDHHPDLLRLGALGVMLFEPAFLVLQCVRPLQVPLLLLAVTFHLLAQQFLLIPFPSLWLCYVGLFAWSPVLAPLEARLLARFGTPRAPAPVRSATPVLAVGTLLLLGVVVAGSLRAVAAWPFACYPTFDRRAGPTLPRLDVDAVDARGRVRRVALGLPQGMDSQRHWGLMWRLVLEPDPVQRDRGLQAYARGLVQRQPELRAMRELRLYRAWIATKPEERQRRRRRDLLQAWPVAVLAGKP